MSDKVLQNLTDNIIFFKKEKENLRKIANKITKIPTSFNIPSEYLTGE